MKTNLFIFGSGDCGQLGMGDEVYDCPRPKSHPFFADKTVLQVAAGGLHSLALVQQQPSSDVPEHRRPTTVYSWGCNDEKSLGHNADEFEVGEVDFNSNSVLFDDEWIVQVAAGDSISAARSNIGRVFTWGTFRDSKGLLGHSDPMHPAARMRSPLSTSSLATGSHRSVASSTALPLAATSTGSRRSATPHSLRPPLSQLDGVVRSTSALTLRTWDSSQPDDYEEACHAQHSQTCASSFSQSQPSLSQGALSQSSDVPSKRSASSSTTSVVMQERPSLMEALTDHFIVQIAAGSNHLVALSDTGAVFAWGSGEQGQLGRRVLERHKKGALQPSLVTPRLLSRTSSSSLHMRVTRVVCGAYHTLLLASVTTHSEDFAGHSSGANSSSSSPIRTTKRSRLDGSQTTASSATSASSSAKATKSEKHRQVELASSSAKGVVALAMGLNNFGQLGMGDHLDRISPEIIPATWPDSVYPVDASAGQHHSLLLMSDGSLYSFGRADSGQLGISMSSSSDVRFSNVPVRVVLPVPAKLTSAGGNHCLAAANKPMEVTKNNGEVVTINHPLMSWGYGEMHQLGHGVDDVEMLPRTLRYPFPSSIVQVSAGGQHSIVLCRDDSC